MLQQPISMEEALNKAQKYCAYQERCTQNVIIKLNEWNAQKPLQEEIILRLKKENFLSDQRFAEIYVRSKMNQNKWGRLKIIAELIKRGFSEDLIEHAIRQIDKKHYEENLRQLLIKKLHELAGIEKHTRKTRVMSFLASKGYETEIIIKQINKIF
nr:RecX family transcriptional regulator [Bacteroidota bacterium]